MFACVCKGITTQQVKETIKKRSAHSLKCLQDGTGAGTDCGSCKMRLERLLKTMAEESVTNQTAD